MALNAGLQMIVSLGEQQLTPLVQNFLASELTAANVTTGAGLTDAEIAAMASGTTKLAVGTLNYGLAHAAAGTPAVKK